MIENRKIQRKISLLASQKVYAKRRNKSENNIEGNTQYSYLKNQKIFNKILDFISVTISSFPIIKYFVIISLFVYVLLSISVYFVKIYSEKVFPTHLDLSITNNRVAPNLNNDINKMIITSVKKHQPRSLLINEIGNYLNSFDAIDIYSVRLGLDGDLQINAIMQEPLLMIETNNGDNYIVGNKLDIISKNPPTNEFGSLLKIYAPNTKIIWNSKQPNLRHKKIQVIKNEIRVNLFLMTKQAKEIQQGIYNLGKGYFLEKLTWTPESGFTIRLTYKISKQLDSSIKPVQQQDKKNTENKFSQTNSNSDVLSVFVGNNDIILKMQKLKAMLADLSMKNIFPIEIDLNFVDKSTFKILQPPLRASKRD